MKTGKYLRYALLLAAVAGHASRPGKLVAASPEMSCNECDENTPCDTECFGVYAEEPTWTTCGDHRNWGGTCAGTCGDGYCDQFENASK
jgi:hypothetical protein